MRLNRFRRRLLLLGFGLGLYLLCAWLSIGFLRSADDVALVWLPAGVGFALVILVGSPGALLMLLAVPLMHLLLAPVPLEFGVYSVLANLLGTGAGWLGYRASGGDSRSPVTVRTGFQILIGGLLLATVSAAIGSFGLVQAGLAPAELWSQSFGAWALGNLFGVIAFTSTLLLWAAAFQRRLRGETRTPLPESRRHPLEYLVWAALTASVLVLVFVAAGASGDQALGLSGLPMAMLLWSAIRFPPLFTFSATSVFAIVVSTLTGLGFAGFSMPESGVQSAVLVGFLCVSMVVPQVLAGAIRETRVAALRLLRRALRDALTGLPNRAAFEDDLRAALADHARRPLLVAYLDLDQFKIINDTLSHAAGDALLHELAPVIRARLPAGVQLYRIGGDEFALLAPHVDSERAPLLLGELCEAVAAFRFAWAQGLVSTRVSIGYAVVEGAEAEFDALLVMSDVDAACFTAKELGGGRVQRAAPGELAVRERTGAMQWVMRLGEALEQDRFELFCQPIVPLHGGVEGGHFEVLLRKRDPASGELLPPGEFIAAAERFGLSSRLDRHVIERCLQWLEAHPQAVQTMRQCSINLSASSLVDPTLARYLRERLARSTVPPHRLCFEVTETGAVRDLERAAGFMHELRALGCRFALDDFGTGFCSFSYLSELEVELLKIDGSFVRAASSSPLALAVVESIVRIAQVTGRRTVAEWVESPELAERMRALGVDYAQGYAFGRPVPMAEYFFGAGIGESGSGIRPTAEPAAEG